MREPSGERPTLLRMAKFQARYSSAQNEAVIAAQLDRGWSAQCTARAAAAGELPAPGKAGEAGETLAPFVMPVTTARDKAGDERRRRKTNEIAARGVGDEARELCAMLLGQARKEVERIGRAQAAGKVDPDRIRRCAAAMREVAQLARLLERPLQGGKQSTGETNGASGKDDDGDDWIGGLAAAG